MSCDVDIPIAGVVTKCNGKINAQEIYAPVTSGVSGQILQSNGNNAPTWIHNVVQTFSGSNSGTTDAVDIIMPDTPVYYIAICSATGAGGGTDYGLFAHYLGKTQTLNDPDGIRHYFSFKDAKVTIGSNDISFAVRILAFYF